MKMATCIINGDIKELKNMIEYECVSRKWQTWKYCIKVKLHTKGSYQKTSEEKTNKWNKKLQRFMARDDETDGKRYGESFSLTFTIFHLISMFDQVMAVISLIN